MVQDRAMCNAEIRNVSHINLLRNRVLFFSCQNQFLEGRVLNAGHLLPVSDSLDSLSC